MAPLGNVGKVVNTAPAQQHYPLIGQLSIKSSLYAAVSVVN